jgi:hypothetical protein
MNQSIHLKELKLKLKTRDLARKRPKSESQILYVYKWKLDGGAKTLIRVIKKIETRVYSAEFLPYLLSLLKKNLLIFLVSRNPHGSF